jgi:hypothetical protein
MQFFLLYSAFAKASITDRAPLPNPQVPIPTAIETFFGKSDTRLVLLVNTEVHS